MYSRHLNQPLDYPSFEAVSTCGEGDTHRRRRRQGGRARAELTLNERGIGFQLVGRVEEGEKEREEDAGVKRCFGSPMGESRTFRGGDSAAVAMAHWTAACSLCSAF